MKKGLRMISFFTGIICVGSMLILGYLYLENLFSYFGVTKKRIAEKGRIVLSKYSNNDM